MSVHISVELHGQHSLAKYESFSSSNLSSLSGCPIAAAEKLSKSQDKQLSQPGSDLLKGSPNDRVLRCVAKDVTSHRPAEHMN